MDVLGPTALALPSNACVFHQPITSSSFLDRHLPLLPLSLSCYFFLPVSAVAPGFSLFLSEVLENSLLSPLQLPVLT